MRGWLIVFVRLLIAAVEASRAPDEQPPNANATPTA